MKKRYFALMLAAALIFACLPQVSALTYNSYAYEVLEDDTVKLTGYRDFYTEDVFVPKEIDGKPVAVIGDNVFKGKSAIKSVVIPETVTEIGSFAFYDCIHLDELIMGKGVKKLGTRCFTNCKALRAVNLQNIEEIGESVFHNCTALEQLNMGSSLKTIGKNAFYGCKLLNMIRFSTVLESIGDYAFYNNIAIEELILPASLKFIGNSAFAGCKKLASVTFGSGELEIGGYAFENCELLTAVTLPANIKAIGRYAFAMREETVFSGNAVQITCPAHSAGFKYCFGADIKPHVSDFGNKQYTPGDINGKGGLTVDDARLALSYAARIVKPDENAKMLADVNGNGFCDTEDARMILQKAIGVYKV